MRQTLDDGIFFDSCVDAINHWDDDWIVCPVCSGNIDYIVDDKGQTHIEVVHNEVDLTEH